MNIRYVADISMQTGKADKQIPNTQRLEIKSLAMPFFPTTLH